MSATTTTALDIITGALRNINALAAGETVGPNDGADALQVLNDLIESWNLDGLFIYCSVENVLNFTAGQYQYTVGNPIGGTFTGAIVAGTATITGVTVPSALLVGASVSDSSSGGQNSLPAGVTVTAIGSNTLTLSAAPTTTQAADIFTYTVPGNFAIARPNRITNAFTRITASNNTQLDYPIEIIPRDQYTSIGFKGVSGPWPTVLYYDPTYPTGTLYFYPNPTSAGQLHLWTDTIITDFQTLNQPLNLPQGYARCLKKNLAIELAPEYGKPAGALLQKQAMESKALIKGLNQQPAVRAVFDAEIMSRGHTDAGFILSGGFR